MRAPILSLCLILTLTPLVSTHAEDPWKFEFVPYIWAAGMDADVTVGSRTADVSVGFDDLLDATDIGGAFLAVTQYERVVLWTQLDYFELDTNNVKGSPERIRAESDSLFLTAALGYQFNTFGERSTIDVMGGFRYLDMENSLTVANLRSKDGGQEIWDGIFMLRPSFYLTDTIRFNPTLSIGTGDSDLTYELQPQFQFQLNDSLVARVGYRRLYYDYSGDHGNFDGSFHGLIAGLGFVF